MLSPYSRFPARAPVAFDRWVGRDGRTVERHEVAVSADPRRALSALASLRIRELPAVRALFALRGLRFDARMTLREFFSTPPFMLLEEEEGVELVAATLLAQGRDGGRGPAPATPAEFHARTEESSMAAVVTFRADPAAGGSRLWTETWVRTRGRPAAVAFSAYWLAIGPWSAWIRRIFLLAARERAERASVP